MTGSIDGRSEGVAFPGKPLQRGGWTLLISPESVTPAGHTVPLHQEALTIFTKLQGDG